MSHVVTVQIGQMKYKDARIKMITEVLNGIKVLKLYAWEESFEKQILEIREKELRQLQKAARLEAVSAFNWFVSPFLVAFSSFVAYVFLSPDNVFTADKAFVAISLLNILRHPLTMLPHTITLVVQVCHALLYELEMELFRFFIEKRFALLQR